MKNTVWRRIFALIGATFAVIAMTIVPTVASIVDTDNAFTHTVDEIREMMNPERIVTASGEGWGDWYQGVGSGISEYFFGTHQYNEKAQGFFDLFPGSDGKYILPLEYYETDENGVNSVCDGFTPISCPDFFQLDECAIMMIRMNKSGYIYRQWAYATNFTLRSEFSSWGAECEDYTYFARQELQLEFDIITSDETSWWEDAYYAGVPDYGRLTTMDYYELTSHIDFWSHKEYRIDDQADVNGYSVTIYDTANNYAANAYNRTLCYVVVSLEQVMMNYVERTAYKGGYNAGKADGYDKGYTEGQTYGESLHANDYQNGYGLGYTDGEAEGWRNGEAHGITQTQGTLDGVKELVFGIFDAPVSLIDGILDFNLFGIHLGGLVKVILTLAVVSAILVGIMRFVKG